MNNRRQFIRRAGTGLAAAVTAPGMFSGSAFAPSKEKKITIGIIGNAHTIVFGKLFNIDKKFPGVEVKYVCGESGEFTKEAMERGNIPYGVRDPLEMMGNVDAVIVDHRHAKYHIDAAAPFVRAGIPAYIDKPFCYRAEKGKELLSMAMKAGTPVTSYSTRTQSAACQDLKEQVKHMKDISQIVCTGRVNLDWMHGGVFFYGVHLLEPVMEIFGEDIERVRITRNGSYGNASLKFFSGLFATFIFKKSWFGWNTFVLESGELKELKPRVEESDPPKYYVDMVNMFRTGKEPRSHQSILNCISVLEAMERSAKNENWEEVEYLEL